LDGRSEHDFWHRYTCGQPEDLQSRFLQAGTDPRTLIVRVLVAAGRAADSVGAGEIIEFLEASFGAFQEVQHNGAWRWSRADLAAALDDLARHGLVETEATGNYRLTQLGQLAGRGLCEVSSVLRLIDCLRPLASDDVSDPVLIAAVQTTVELDQVLFPINKKSTQKEPQTWMQELRGQGIPGVLLGNFQRNIAEPHHGTLRAKKAVACLLYVSGRPMEDIERALTRFGGAFDGAAGPIRAVAGRTCDMLPTAADIAEILHPDLDLAERVSRLVVRLDLGIEGAAVDLARHTRGRLSRGDYRSLVAAHLILPANIKAASDGAILACAAGNRTKLRIIREGADAMVEQARRQAAQQSLPILEPYQA
jgi:ATP-dependent DNA helicase